MSRTYRKPKTGPKAVDRTCRNHGTCPTCQAARERKRRLQDQQTMVEMMFRDIFPDVQFRVVENDE